MTGVGAAGGTITQKDALGRGGRGGQYLGAGESVRTFIGGDGGEGAAGCTQSGEVRWVASQIQVRNAAPRAG
jgi:hypothetical protein